MCVFPREKEREKRRVTRGRVQIQHRSLTTTTMRSVPPQHQHEPEDFILPRLFDSLGLTSNTKLFGEAQVRVYFTYRSTKYLLHIAAVYI